MKPGSKLVIIGIILGVIGILNFLALLEPVGDPTRATVVVIPSGASLSHVAQRLHTQGILGSPWAFQWLGRLKGVERKIIPGEYEFRGGLPPSKILQKLVDGQVVQHTLTIPEGFTNLQIAELLEKNHLVSRAAFLDATRDSALIHSFGFTVPDLEGYLFPDTYFVTRSMTAASIVRMMVSRLQQTLTPEFVNRAAEIGLSMHEVLTLASVIEKETGLPEERALISGVFHNRLQKKIPLQSDPTVIYALERFDGDLRKRDLAVNSPYNTYRVRGLPPGPIANPGLEAIRAALYPAPTNFLYFVSRNDGSHKFSSTLSEHNSAVQQYQVRQIRQAS